MRIALRSAMAAMAVLMMGLVSACGAEEPTATPDRSTTPETTAPSEPAPTPTPVPVSEPDAPAPEPGAAATPTPTQAPRVPVVATPVPTAPPPPSFSAEDHWKGKTIRLVLDHRPGGGTDLQGRYFGANWSKFIPGNPRIIVSNIPPSPSGTQYLWDSDPDGYTLGISTIGFRSLYDDRWTFQADEFRLVGASQLRDMEWLVLGEVPYDSFDQASGGNYTLTLAEQVATADELTGKFFAAAVLALWFDIPLRIATVATAGSSDSLLMLERGDINGYIAGAHWFQLPVLRPGWLRDGFLKPFANMNHPDFELPCNPEICMELDNVATFMSPEQLTQWNPIVRAEVSTTKEIVAPPNTPDHIVNSLRDAYAAAVGNEEFASGLARAQGQPVFHVTGEQMEALFDQDTAELRAFLPQYQDLQQQVYDKYFR